MDISLGYAFTPLASLCSNAPGGEQLFQYVQEKNIKKAMSALLHGTRPDFQDPQTGDTALHVAVLIQDEVLVKLLIVFDANLTIKNKQHQTALDIAQGEGATSIAKVIKDILDLQQELKKDEPKANTGLQAEAAIVDDLLLSLDGGGIRGLVFVQVLLEMEKRRKQLYPSAGGTLLSKFNWITGNSTGGIAALTFAAAHTTVEQGRKMYFDLKDEVLGGDPPIPNDHVDKVFRKVYGQHHMSDIKGVNVSVMTTLATESPPILHIMSNYGGARNKQDPPDKQLVWKAARATSSVPIFFHPQDDRYLDGGLIANNPTTDAIIDMFEYAKKEMKGKPNLKIVLSLGCGDVKPTPIEDIDFEQSKFGDAIGHAMEILGMRKKGKEAQEFFLVLHNHKAFFQLMSIDLAQITQPNGEVLKRSSFISEMLGAKFFRINPIIDDVEFLVTADEIIINMLYQVVYYMLKNCHEVIDPVLECIYGE